MNTQILAEELPGNSPLQVYLHDILEGTRMLEETLQLLVDFTAPRAPRPGSVCLREVSAQVLQWIELHPPRTLARARVTGTPDLRRAHADPDHVRTMLIQLVRNGIEALHSDGELLLACRNISPAPEPGFEGLGVEVEIQDNGTGIAEEHLPHVFEPFFTTRAKRIGLGLNIVSLLCEINHGRVVLESRPGEGTRVRVQLPAVPSPSNHGRRTTAPTQRDAAPRRT